MVHSFASTALSDEWRRCRLLRVSWAPVWLSGMTYYLCCRSDQMFNSVRHMAG